MTIVGRKEQYRRLKELFRESSSGRGRAVVVAGTAGTGKTALLDAFTEWATEEGSTVLKAAGSPTEEDVPLGIVSQLAHSPGAPTRTLRHARKLLGTGSHENPGDRSVRLHELCSTLLGLADQPPLVIVVDDLQHADRASLQWLLHLMVRLCTTRVLIVLAYRTGSRPLHSQLHAELRRHPHSAYIRLAPLGENSISSILHRCLGSRAAAELSAEVCHASGGNPVLVHSLVDDCRNDWPRSGELVTGDAFQEAVLNCLYRLDPAITELAEALAVLGEEIPTAMFCRLLAMGPEVIDRHLSVLQQVGLVDGKRFRHPRTRAAVLSGVSAARREAIHHRAALFLHQDGAPSIQVAGQMVASSRADEPWAISLLQEAADQAVQQGDLDLALTCLRLAYPKSTDLEQRLTLKSQLMQVEWWNDPSVASRHLDALVAAARAGELNGSNMPSLVEHLLWWGRYDDAVAVLRQLLATDPLAPSIAQALLPVRLSLFYAFPSLCRLLPGQEGDAVLAARVPESDVDCGLRFILRHESLNDSMLSVALATLSAVSRAEQLYPMDDVEHYAIHRRFATWRAIVAGVRAEAACQRGEPELALALAEEAVSTLTLRGWGVYIGLPLATAIRAASALHWYDRAHHYATLPVPGEMIQTLMGIKYLHARGSYYHAAGNPYEALSDFLACRDITASWRSDVQAPVPWCLDAARAYLDLGWEANAYDLIRSEGQRRGPGDERFHAEAAQLLSRSSQRTSKPSPLRGTLRELPGPSSPVTLEPGTLALGQSLRAPGQPEHVRRTLRIARRAGSEYAAARMSTLPFSTSSYAGGTGVSGNERAILSDAERRVAVLAASGHTNRKIAEQLFITVSTVEQHLTRVYRKLQVNGRTDLARCPEVRGPVDPYGRDMDPGPDPVGRTRPIA